ncbi:MAG TPA: glycoside hydrolase family 18 protein [Acidisarcina sp.]
MEFALLLGVARAQSAASRPQSPATSNTQAAAHPILVGYFPQWGLYSEPPYLVKNLVTSGAAALLDQINYAQGFVTSGHCSVADPNADLNHAFTATESVDRTADLPDQPFRGYMHQVAELKRRYPHLKLLISLEGNPLDFAADAQPETRHAFVASCIDVFIKGNLAPGVTAPGLFDGIDVDWEYPQQADAANYLALLTEMRQQMDALRPGLTLSVAMGHSPRMYDGTDIAAVAHVVDEVGLMTYDFTGPWSHNTGFIAPLYKTAQRWGGSVDGSVSDYLAAGVPASKLLVGLPFYGYGWQQVPDTDNGLAQEGEPIHGDRPYNYIETLAADSSVYRDPASSAPWLFDGDVFWTYEDPTSIQAKGQYAIDHKLGGMMIWELSGDNPSALLLKTAKSALAPAGPRTQPGTATASSHPSFEPTVKSAPVPERH